jgi:hypothetical protein
MAVGFGLVQGRDGCVVNIAQSRLVGRPVCLVVCVACGVWCGLSVWLLRRPCVSV